LAEFFIKSLCPPGGIVLDPFSGSGTSVAVALRLGRNGIGMDIRRSQAGIARRRIDDAVDPSLFVDRDD
jgi:DNA modification methylase